MKALVPIADGSEEMEAVIIIDTLRRAGWSVTVAGIGGEVIEASRGVRLVPDLPWEAVDPDDYDVLLLPGGWNGTLTLRDHEGVKAALRAFAESGRWYGAICAAPLVLHAAGLLEGRRFTCYPGVEKELPSHFERSEDKVVVDGRMITSQGPGTAFEFALRAIAECDDPARAEEVRRGLLL